MAEHNHDLDESTAGRAIDHEIYRILVESPTLADATPKLLARIGEALGWEMGAIWEIEGSGEALRCVDTWHAQDFEPGNFEQLTKTIRLAPGLGLPGRVWAAGEPKWIVDVTRDQNFQRASAAEEAGLHGAFAFPIRGESGILGVIEFFSREVREPDTDLLDGMVMSGGLIGRFVERKWAEEGIRRSAALKTAMLTSAVDCVIAIDHEGRIVEFNPAAERTFGYERHDVIGKEMAELIIPPHLRDRHRHGMARYLAGGEAPVLDRPVELPGMRADGSEFPAELAITRIGAIEPPMFVGYVRDITERKRGEEALQFLLTASAAVEESLDLDTMLQSIARVAIPYLADGCMVDLLEKDGSIRRAASAAADPSLEPVLDELRRHRIDPEGPHPIANVMRTGRTEIVPDVSDPFRREIAATGDYYEALQRWPARSVVVAPMKTGGRLLGTLAFAAFSPERTYGAHEVSVIEELARRAASAVDNARLFEERSQLARTLQQSLVPPRLPELPGAEVAARFQPAGAGTEVGGDFYDVFDAGERGWVIAIGDVSGRGVDAAATTVLARHTIRAAAIQVTDPSQILITLNEALRSHAENLRFCTVAVGLLRLEEPQATLSLASAGHPLPLLLQPDGKVEPIGTPGTVLGILPDPELSREEIELSAGDTVVFYTDGVSNIRVGERRIGAEEFSSIVATCVDLDAARTAQCIDEAVVDARTQDPYDDAAILVLRILEQEMETSDAPALVSSET